MASTSETGHAKNVANFEDLIAFCTSFGPIYNPSKEALGVKALTIQLKLAQEKMGVEKKLLRTFNQQVNNRMDNTKPLKPLATRIINALGASDTSAETIKDAKTINRKIQGQRAAGSVKVTETLPIAENADAPGTKKISVSQQSYDSIADNFNKLLALLQTEANYIPNEPDLQVNSVINTIEGLRANNRAVGDTYAGYIAGLNDRNKTLYASESGLIDTALSVKKYVLSIFAATSPEYKKVNSIKFRNFK